MCNKYGHKRPDCPTNNKLDQGNQSDSVKPTDSSKQPDQVSAQKPRTDWTKFINTRKSNDTKANCAVIIDDETSDNFAMSAAISSPHFQIMEYVRNDISQCFETELLMDTGAGRSMFPDLHYLDNVIKLSNPVRVKCADQGVLFGTHSGRIRINAKSRNDDTITIVVNNVLYVPGLSCSLLSGDSITQNDIFNVNFS